MSWLSIFLARLAAGERWRKATPDDYRQQFGSLFLCGLFAIIGMKAGRVFLDHASIFAVWAYVTLLGCLVVFGGAAWARRVPAVASLLLALFTWGTFAWMLVTGHL